MKGGTGQSRPRFPLPPRALSNDSKVARTQESLRAGLTSPGSVTRLHKSYCPERAPFVGNKRACASFSPDGQRGLRRPSRSDASPVSKRSACPSFSPDVQHKRISCPSFSPDVQRRKSPSARPSGMCRSSEAAPGNEEELASTEHVALNAARKSRQHDKDTAMRVPISLPPLPSPREEVLPSPRQKAQQISPRDCQSSDCQSSCSSARHWARRRSREVAESDVLLNIPKQAWALREVPEDVDASSKGLDDGHKKSRSSVAINRKFLRRSAQDGSITDHYSWSKENELGRGSFGRVYKACSTLNNKRVVAVKQVVRSAIEHVDELWLEIGILSDLDHPNILRFLEAYQDYRHIYIVTEVCLGGNLLRWIRKVKGNVAFIARAAREIVGALSHCHVQGICHRDLKPENVLLIRDSVDSPIRVADFGLAKRCSQRVLLKRQQWLVGQSPETPVSGRRMLCRMTSFKGTPIYMAPEVVRILDQKIKSQSSEKTDSCNKDNALSYGYDFRCDIWSLGIILYMLLKGREPYTIEEVSEFVAEGVPLNTFASMVSEDFAKQQPMAFDFINSCLKPDLTSRPQAWELLGHPWISQGASTTPQAQKPKENPLFNSELADRLQSFTAFTKFKKAVLTASVRYLATFELEQLRSIFQSVDTDNSGAVSVQELLRSLRQLPENSKAPRTPNVQHSESFARELLGHLDTDLSGEIDYTEFIAAAMDHTIEERKDLLWSAFRSFDLDGTNTISRQELEHVLDTATADQVLQQSGRSHDGEILFDDFVELLRQG